jgi:hypothetical protein
MNDVIQIVKEQDKWTPLPPPGHKFQISILAWIERDGGSVAPWAFARLAVPRLAELVKANHISSEYWTRKRCGFLRCWHDEFDHSRPWADLMSSGDAELEENGEFPHRITFQRDGELVLLEQTEFWSRAGGPTPYHDSVALTFSSELTIQSQIEEIILDICGSLGITYIKAEQPHAVDAEERRN